MGISIKLLKKVNGFSLDVQWEMDNELMVLFGYSGAGKSMTLQLIAGIMAPDKGLIIANDRILYNSSAKVNLPPQKRSLGYVSQDGAVFPHMTVKENIAYGLRSATKDERVERVNRMLEVFRLKGLADNMPAEISGGQKQRVAIARALIGNPELLLLDEPFSALDNPIRMEMRRLLKEVRDRFNIPVILVTHDMSEASSMADKIIVYAKGRVVQAGKPVEVFNKPICPEVEMLVNFRESMPQPGRFSPASLAAQAS